MILLFMLLEPILFPIQDIPLYPTNKAETVLILLKTFLLLTYLSEFIDNNSANDLIHDNLNDEQVAKINQYVPK